MPPILMRMNNAKAHIDFLTETRQTFELSSSNYTTGIKSDAWPGKYVQNLQSNRAFACFAKLKKAVKDRPVPDVKSEDVRYFQHNFKKDLYVERVTNIDIKSAYATILFNDGYIDEATYKYVCGATKQERLASVGMLASRKEVFQFVKGEPVDEEEVVSGKAGFFFYSAKRTFEIMDDLKRICGNSYLYTWVDGIYFLPNSGAERECRQYLEGIRFGHTVDYLSGFDVSIKQDLIVVRFRNGKGKSKLFNLPNAMSEFKRIMMDSILSINSKKGEKSDAIKSASKRNISSINKNRHK